MSGDVHVRIYERLGVKLPRATRLVVIVKETKAHAEAVREECRAFLEGKLKLTLNMEKTHMTHVNDGFVFLGHRIIRKRGSSGRMAVVTTIPKEKAKAFARRLSKVLSGDHDLAKVDMVDRLNRQLRGWAAFYKYTADLAKRFVSLLNGSDIAELDEWIMQAGDSELKSFANGIARDIDAVRAAITTSWTTSPVEGQISRIKAIKRQMYGRASYPLLRRRVLLAA